MEKNRQDRKKIYIGLLLFAIGIFALGFYSSSLASFDSSETFISPKFSSPSYDNNQEISVNALIQHWEYDESTGERELVFEQEAHNIVYNNFLDEIKLAVGNGQILGVPYDQIALCNSTQVAAGQGCGVPAADNSEEFISYDQCGLTNATGTYVSLGTGNWSVQHTFTASCDSLTINSTRVQNRTSDLMAGLNFSGVTLNTNDQLTVNWTLTAESA